MRYSCYLDTAHPLSLGALSPLVWKHSLYSTIKLSEVFILLFTSMTNGIHRWAPPSYLLFTMFLKMVIYRSMKSMETIPKHQHHILPKIISRYLVEDNNPNKSMPLHFFVIKTEMCATLPSKNNNLCPLTQGYISDTWQY